MGEQTRTILVTGATGQQGGAAARHLLKDGWKVRALVRDPGKPAAEQLAAQGVELIQGDLNDRESLDRAVRGVYGVFGVQTFFEQGVEAEARQGQALADAAHAAGVRHFVYSSVGGADRNTNIPHFESKWQIEQHIRELGLPATVLRPVYFMDNLQYPGMGPSEQDGTLVFASPLRADVELQMIAADDIGAFAALAFANPQEYIGKAIEIAGDSLTMPELLEAYERATGKPTRYVELPIEVVRDNNKEMAVMFEWFNDHGYEADIAALRRVHPGLKNLEGWLSQRD